MSLTKRVTIGVLGGCLVAGVAAPNLLVSGSGDAVAAKERKGIALSVATTSQRRILTRRRVPVRVRSTRAGTFRVFASSRRGKRRPRVVITRTREVTLAAGRARTVRLRLVRAGRRELAGCTPRKLIANALRLRGERKRPGRAKRRGRALRRDASRCRSGAT